MLSYFEGCGAEFASAVSTIHLGTLVMAAAASPDTSRTHQTIILRRINTIQSLALRSHHGVNDQTETFLMNALREKYPQMQPPAAFTALLCHFATRLEFSKMDFQVCSGSWLASLRQTHEACAICSLLLSHGWSTTMCRRLVFGAWLEHLEHKSLIFLSIAHRILTVMCEKLSEDR